MSLLRYVSHAQVVQDPAVPVPRWALSDEGRRRVAVLAERPWLQAVGRIVASDETKAVETATILADRIGLDVEVRPRTGETDRSATGYVSRERHDELARRYFAEPTASADGWERAVDSQRRVVAALADLLVEPVQVPDPGRPDVIVVGHGGVGTLLWCHLAATPIDQRHDQPTQGHTWTWDRASQVMLHPWRPIDEPGGPAEPDEPGGPDEPDEPDG